MITAVLGPPGTGKTHYLISRVHHILKSTSIAPEQIGYFSFTNRAADEARVRAVSNIGLPANRFPYFRTLHSMAFYQLGLNKNLVFGQDAAQKFASWLGLDLTYNINSYTTDDSWPERTDDDRTMFLMNKARVNLIADERLEEINWPCDWQRAWQIIRGYRKFKQAKYFYDFSDMLEQLIERKAYPNLDVIVLDEAQDLSPLQWQCVNGLTIKNPNAQIFIAGDDDQAIYQWAGASVRRFMGAVASADKTINLSHSHRVPIAAHRVAQHVIDFCKRRVPKKWKPTEHPGRVEYASAFEDIRWELKKNYLCLARNNYLLKRAVQFLNDYKLPWSWKTDKATTPIKLSTIHGAKGAQADTVVLDLGMSKAAFNEGWRTDAEARVWYVAVTRAKNDLIFMEAANNSTSSLYIEGAWRYTGS